MKIYRRYAQIPFRELYKGARNDFSVSRDLLAGAPTSLFTTFIERQVSRLWLNDPVMRLPRRWLVPSPYQLLVLMADTKQRA